MTGPSNLQYGFDNRIWGSVGDAGFDGEVGGRRVRFDAAIYRFRVDGSELETVARFDNNTWALGFSETFEVFANTALDDMLRPMVEAFQVSCRLCWECSVTCRIVHRVRGAFRFDWTVRHAK